MQVARKKPVVIRKDLEEAWNPGPTPETAIKLRSDVIEGLYRKGKIDGDMRRAAERIEDMFDVICRGMFVRAMDHRRPYSDPPTTLPGKGLELMTIAQMDHWREVYVPWNDSEKDVLIGRENRPRTELVHHIVVENRGLTETGRTMKVGDHSILDHLRSALRRYCLYAGYY